MKLQYEKPAELWTDALPIGNGSLGAMVFGGVHNERLQCNQDTLWSGSPRDQSNPEAYEHLPHVRKLLKEKKYIEADEAAKKLMGAYTQSYLPFCDIHLAFDHEDSYSNYQRNLDLTRAVLNTSYESRGVTYKRELFSSFPDRAIVLKLSSNQPQALSFSVRISSQLQTISQASGQQIHLIGRCPDHVDPSYYNTPDPIIYKNDLESEAIRFEAILDLQHIDGEINVSKDSLIITDATEVIIRFAAATSFNGYDRLPKTEGKDYRAEVSTILQQAVAKPYHDLLRSHLEDYQPLFQRVDFELDSSASKNNLPTDQRISKYGARDQGLVELLFHYGRYLMIASSRPGSQPANLQGIWNDELRPPWSSNYTLNINAQMNYWPVEVCQLSECHTPFLGFIQELSETGKQTASIHYGCDGWTAHHNSDIWRHSLPAGNKNHGETIWTIWPMAGAWLSQHVWEHYLFHLDEQYLSEFAYPIMKGAAEFCLDWLILNQDGYLITSPSTSPEHCFMINGKPCGVSEASTMDMALIRELFVNVLEAATILDTDQAFSLNLEKALEKLIPYQIGERNRLQEWSEDFLDHEEKHRHVSHLYGVYPGSHLTQKSAEPYLDAAKQALIIRSNEGTGWSLAWKICLWARFGDGEQAHQLIENLLELAEDQSGFAQKGGVYNNLFDAHPPFQIDGNFGYTAGVVEMLVQSHNDYLEFLPTLPKQWNKGRLKGVRARGGFIIDIEWVEEKLVHASIFSEKGQPIKLLSTHQALVHSEGEQVETTFNSKESILSFPTTAGQKYQITSH